MFRNSDFSVLIQTQFVFCLSPFNVIFAFSLTKMRKKKSHNIEITTQSNICLQNFPDNIWLLGNLWLRLPNNECRGFENENLERCYEIIVDLESKMCGCKIKHWVFPSYNLFKHDEVPKYARNHIHDKRWK